MNGLLCTECCAGYKLAVIREFGSWPAPKELETSQSAKLPAMNPAVTLVMATNVAFTGPNAPVGIVQGQLVCFEHLQVQSEAASKLLGG